MGAMSGERPGGARWTLGIALDGHGCRALAVRVSPSMVYCGECAGTYTSLVPRELIDSADFAAFIDSVVADLLDLTHNCSR